MKLNILSKAISLLLIVIIPGGCMANLSPIEVSERFWTAVQNMDATTARKYVSSGNQVQENLTEDILPIDKFTLGRTIIDGEQAWVDTNVVIAGDKPFTMPLKTVLLQEDKQWKVDYDATVASVSKGSAVARVVGSIASLSEQFTDELDRSLEEIQQALPEIQKEIEKIEDSLKEKLPELRQRMDEFLRQLEEALGDKAGKRRSEGTTEI